MTCNELPPAKPLEPYDPRCDIARDELQAAGIDVSAWTEGDLEAHYDREIRPRGANRVRGRVVKISICGVDLDPSGFVDGSEMVNGPMPGGVASR